MRPFNYSKIKEEKWNSEILGLIAAIYKFAGNSRIKRQNEKRTTNTRIKQFVEEKTTPKNGDEEEIAGYRDV